MRRKLLVIATLVFCLLPFRAAEAAKVRFGQHDEIHLLQDVDLKGPNGERLFLGYMTQTQYFAAGLYVVDAGYALGVKGDRERFFRMPQGDELMRYQRDGLLPNPLPAYRLSPFDYLIGYSLWLVVAFAVGWVAIGIWWKKRRAVAASSP